MPLKKICDDVPMPVPAGRPPVVLPGRGGLSPFLLATGHHAAVGGVQGRPAATGGACRPAPSSTTGEAEYGLLDRVAVAPVIFQEFVPAEVDLRVTVIGERLIAAAIHSQELPYPLDFRLFLDRDPGVRMEPTERPAEVEQGLLRLLKSAGLRYGAVDLRRTPGGRHVFLEVNPSGQWRFVEDMTGQPITSAMARLLTDLDAA